MISADYRNRMFYYKIISNYLTGKIDAQIFRETFWTQRSKDIKTNIKNGYFDYYSNKQLANNENKFENEYGYPLRNSVWSDENIIYLNKYEQGVLKYNIKGETFFSNIYSFIDPYIREYYPSDSEDFDPKESVDEKTLKKVIKAAYEVLEKHKDRWLDIEEDKKQTR